MHISYYTIQLTYLVKRGLANLFASFDGISILETPDTIMRSYRITTLWRYICLLYSLLLCMNK